MVGLPCMHLHATSCCLCMQTMILSLLTDPKVLSWEDLGVNCPENEPQGEQPGQP